MALDTLMARLPWSGMVNVQQQNPLISDPVNIFYPYNHFHKTEMAQGRISFWNPTILSGLPTVPPTHPMTALMYLVLPMTIAHDALLFIHLVFAGICTYFYLRQIRLQKGPALFGAVTWMFNGYVMVWFEFEHVVILAPTLPAALLYFERFIANQKPISLLLFLLAIVYALATNYSHVIAYQFLFIGVYVVLRLMRRPQDRYGLNLISQHLRLILIATAIFGLISSSFFASHFSFLTDDQQRKRHDFSELYERTGQVYPRYLATMVYPDYFGSPAKGMALTPAKNNAQPYNNYNELCIYFGVVPLFLAIAACVGWRRVRMLPFFWVSAVTTLAMAMGSWLYYPIVLAVPGLDYSTPTRILYLFGFCASVLCAMGLRSVLYSTSTSKRIIAGLWVIPVGAAVGLAAIAQTEGGIDFMMRDTQWLDWHQHQARIQHHFSITSPPILVPILLVAIAILALFKLLWCADRRMRRIFTTVALFILITDLFLFARSYNTLAPRGFEFPETPAIGKLQDDDSLFRIMTIGPFMHNSFSPFKIQDAGGYASFYPADYGEYLSISQNQSPETAQTQFSRWVSFSSWRSPLIDLLNIKYILAPAQATLDTPGLKLIHDQEIRIYENTNAFPRLFFVPSATIYQDPADVLKRLQTATRETLKQTALLLAPGPGGNDDAASGPPRAEGTYRIHNMTYQSDYIAFDITTDQRGYIVLSDSFHPGWAATLDGTPTPVLKANHVMRAIQTPDGTHRIELEFHTPMATAYILTAVGWALLAITMVYARRQ